MPPRYAYWTILVDNQPTAFRAAAQEDLMPTFKRLKEKHPSAVMMWFQNGKLWPSRLDAQEAMRARGEKGRRGDTRQGGFRDRHREPRAPATPRTGKLDWKPKGTFTPETKRVERPRLEWKPKGAARADRPSRSGEAKRTWIPKEEYKKSQGIDAPRDSKWRPGGSHRDPRQKYKDAKKARWTSFKKTVRERWESKARKKTDD